MNKIILKKNNLPQKTGCYFTIKTESSLVKFVKVYRMKEELAICQESGESCLMRLYPDALWSDEIEFSEY